MFPLPSILTTFRIPKKPRNPEDSNQTSKVEQDNSIDEGNAPHKLLPACPKQKQIAASSDRTLSEQRRQVSSQEAGDTSFRYNRSLNQPISAEQKNIARVAPWKDDAGQNSSGCLSTTIGSGEQKEVTTSTPIASPVARRRINFNEYMSSKIRTSSVCANSLPTNSELSDRLSPLDTRKLAPEIPAPVKFTDRFYTDTLATLQHESRQVSDQSGSKGAFNSCNEDLGVLTAIVSDTGDDVLMDESNLFIAKSPAIGDATDVTSEMVDSSIIETVTVQPTLSSILCPPGYQRISKKSVSWADAQGNELEAVQYFISDIEGRRPRCLENIGKYEVQIERSIRFGAGGDVFLGDAHGFLTAHQIAQACEQQRYGPLIEVALPPYIQKKVINSNEMKVQSERQRVTLQDIFLPFVSVPSTPAEPDPNCINDDRVEKGETGTLLLEPKIIPVDDVSDEEMLPFSPSSNPIETQDTQPSPVRSEASSRNSNCPAIPPSLRPELADLLSRAHQKAEISSPANHPLNQSNPPLSFSTNSVDLFDRLKEVLSNEALCRPSVTEHILSGLLCDKGGTSTPSNNQSEMSNAAFVPNKATKMQNQMIPRVNMSTGTAPTTNFVDFQCDGRASAGLSGCYNEMEQNTYSCPAYAIDSSVHDQQPMLSDVPDRLKNPDFPNCGQIGDCIQRGVACLSSHGPIKSLRSLRRNIVGNRSAPYHHPRPDMMRFQLRAGPPPHGQQSMRAAPPLGVRQDASHQVWPPFVPASTDAMCRLTCPPGGSMMVDDDFNARGMSDSGVHKGPRQMFGRFLGPSFRLSNTNVHMRGPPPAFDRRSGPPNYCGRFQRGQQRGGRPATRKYARGFPRVSSRPPAKRELGGNDASGEWL